MLQPELVKKLKVGVLLGGLSSEKEVSEASGQAVYDALIKRGYLCQKIHVNRDLCKSLKEHNIEIAFNALHGTFGEDGCVQGVCEVAGIPYTGSSVLSSALTFDKIITRNIMAAQGLPIAYGEVIDNVNQSQKLKETFLAMGPAVVKPAAGGSTVGITIVRQPDQWDTAVELAYKYSKQILVESYLEGREFSVPVYDNNAFGVIEIKPNPKYDFFNYESKYNEDGAVHTFPAKIPKELTVKLEQIANKVHLVTKCNFYSRVDFMLDGEGNPCVLEINSLPGLTPLSLYPECLPKLGISFEECVEQILLSAGTHLKDN